MTNVTQTPPCNTIQVFYEDAPLQLDQGKKTYAELLIDRDNNTPYRALAMVDTGSDASLIHEKFLKQIMSLTEIQRRKTNVGLKLKSFSNHPITVLFSITLPLRNFGTTPQEANFIVIKGDPAYTPDILLGMDIIRSFQMKLNFNETTPNITIHKNGIYKLQCIQAFPSDANTGTAYTTIAPGETKPIVLTAHPLCTIRRGTNVLITNSNKRHILITPTKYIAFCNKDRPFMACATNTGTKTFTGTIKADISNISGQKFLNSKTDNKEFQKIKSVRREVVPQEINQQLPKLRLLEELPASNTAQTAPLQAFLIMTPTESREKLKTLLNTENLSSSTLIKTNIEEYRSKDSSIKSQELQNNLDPAEKYQSKDSSIKSQKLENNLNPANQIVNIKDLRKNLETIKHSENNEQNPPYVNGYLNTDNKFKDSSITSQQLHGNLDQNHNPEDNNLNIKDLKENLKMKANSGNTRENSPNFKQYLDTGTNFKDSSIKSQTLHDNLDIDHNPEDNKLHITNLEEYHEPKEISTENKNKFQDLKEYLNANNKSEDSSTTSSDPRKPLRNDEPKNKIVEHKYKLHKADRATSAHEALQSIKPGYTTTPEQITDFPEKLLQPNGFEIPCNLDASIKDIVQLSNFPETHQPYIHDIFIKKYPTTVALHSFDIGNVSQTLGYYKLELKDNEQLPKFRKIYYTGPQELQQMRDICDFLIRYNVIERCNQRDKGAHLVASAGYLVEKPNKHASARLVIDFKLLNQMIKTSPPVIPCVTTTLQQLRNKIMFTTLDLTQAFYSISLDPSCKHLTRFAVQTGSYVFKNLAMGLSGSPEIFANYAYQMIHMTPKLDNQGKPCFTEKNRVHLIDDYMDGIFVFYDDVLITSEWKGTYEATLSNHFKLVEKLIQKLAFHKAKISFEKSKIGKAKIYFLGWTISNNTIIPCEKRTNKLLESEFPTNLKQMRSFLGLLNTLRTVLPPIFMPDMAVLSQLTSSTKKYAPQPHHTTAFTNIKHMLVSTPLFSNIIEPSFKKLVFTDASDKGCYAGVLAQIQSTDQLHIPDHILLDDAVDRLILKHKLCYESVPIYLHDTFILKSKLEQPYNKTTFKSPDYLDTLYLGYNKDTVNQSLYKAIRSVQYAYGSTMSTPAEIKLGIKEKLKTSIYKYKILSFQCKDDKTIYDDFMSKFNNDETPIDDNLYLGHIIADILKRPLIIIAPSFKQQIHQFNMNSTAPPIILGLHKHNNKLIFRPYFQKHASFNLQQIKNMQIIAFWSKQISPSDQKKTIMEKELYAILGALENFKKLIGRSEVLLITDSKPLFHMFSKPVIQNSAKLMRWSLKMASDYGLITFRFIKSSHNLADFLTRDYKMSKTDLKRIPIKDFQVGNIDANLDHNKEYTINEFQTFVNNNQHHLQYKPSQQTIRTMSINVKTLTKLIQPLTALQDRLDHAEILKQKAEFPNIFQTLNSKPGSTVTHDKHTYKIHQGLLCKIQDDTIKIMIPTNMEALIISYAHLSMNHAGLKRMRSHLEQYEIPKKLEKIKHLITRCYSCFLVNKSTHQIKLGTFPIPTYIFETMHMDLLENLNPQNGYENVLICCCPLTKFMYAFPLKNKKPDLMMYNFLHALYITYNIRFVVSDNGPIFNNKTFLSLLHTLNIKKIQIASRHPQSNGQAEGQVKLLKVALKKTLATFPTFSWLDILPIIIKTYNTSPTANHYTPLQLLHGDRAAASSQLQEAPLTKIYPMLQNQKTEIQTRTKSINDITTFIRNEIHLNKIETNLNANKNRILPKLTQGDYVFVKDRSITPGSGRPLRTTFSTDVYVVLQVRNTTAVVTRPADAYPTVYSLGDLKKFSSLDPIYNKLPIEVRNVLQHKFETWDNFDFEILRKHSSFNHPTGPPLFELNEIQNDIGMNKLTNTDLTDAASPTILEHSQHIPILHKEIPPTPPAPRTPHPKHTNSGQIMTRQKTKLLKQQPDQNIDPPIHETEPQTKTKKNITMETLLNSQYTDKAKKTPKPNPNTTDTEIDSNTEDEDTAKQVTFQH